MGMKDRAQVALKQEYVGIGSNLYSKKDNFHILVLKRRNLYCCTEYIVKSVNPDNLATCFIRDHEPPQFRELIGGGWQGTESQ